MSREYAKHISKYLTVYSIPATNQVLCINFKPKLTQSNSIKSFIRLTGKLY